MNKCIIGTILLMLLASTVMAVPVPTTDSFRWTLYDDFSNSLRSIDNWAHDGYTHNMSIYYNLNEKMVLQSCATYQWGADCQYYASLPEENLRGIKADISLTDTSYPAFGTGRNVVGIRVSDNLDVYMGFFSNGYTHNLQVGYRLNGEDIIPEGWESQQLTFEQEYEIAIVLDDTGRDILFFLNNQLFEMANIYPASDGIDRFFVESDITSFLDTNFSIDNFSVLVPEPATFLLVGLGGLILRKR